jgi:hypothetical protein
LDDDPKGTVIDGVRYTFTTDDSVDVLDECIVLESTMDAAKIDELLNSLTPGTAEFADRFHGLSFLLPAGEGEVCVTTQTFGTHELNIKVGTGAAVAFSQPEKGEVHIAYNCTEPTMVYIYGTEADLQEAAPRYTPIRFAQAEDGDEPETTGAVRIYSMNLTGIGSALEDVFGTQSSSTAIKVVLDGKVVIIRDGKIYNLFGTELN